MTMPTRAFVYNRNTDYRHTGPLTDADAELAVEQLRDWHKGLLTDPNVFEIRHHVTCSHCGFFPIEGATGKASVPCPKCGLGVRA